MDFKINKSDWFVDANNQSSIVSEITMQVSSAAANIIIKGKPFISVVLNSSEPPIKSRITMVDDKSRSQTDTSTKGWGATCNGISTGRMLSAQETKYHINILELLAVKLARQRFTKYRNVKGILHQVDNIVVLKYLIKMEGGEGGREVLKTAEYLPSELNVVADWESRNSLESSEWMLSHQIFQKVCQVRGFLDIELFASRLSH